ncbi:MAG: pilin [Patescibacteria group bacterium]|nr:pilin [Patescibacteria group bacterium]
MNKFLKSIIFIFSVFSFFIFFTDVYSSNEKYCITPKGECFVSSYSVLENGVEVQKDFSSQCLTGSTIFNDSLTCNNFLNDNFTFCLKSPQRECDLVYKAICSSANGKSFGLSNTKTSDYYLNSCKRELPMVNVPQVNGVHKIDNVDGGFFKTNFTNGPDINDLAHILPSYIHYTGITDGITFGQVANIRVTIQDIGNGGGELLSTDDYQMNIVSFYCKTSQSDCTSFLKYDLPANTQLDSPDILIDASLPQVVFDISFDSAEYLKSLAGKSLPDSVNLTVVVDWNSGILPDRKNVFMTYPINSKLTSIDCSTIFDENECKKSCIWSSTLNKCYSKTDENVCSNLNTAECKKSVVCALNESNKCELSSDINTRNAVDAVIKSEHPTPENSLLPECAFTGSCRDVNDLVKLGLVIINYIFSIVAGLAFIMFVYGGFTWIFSFGNSDKVKKGQQIFVYAVIGLVIVFTAYIFVGFLLTALNVSQSFRII